MVKVKDVNICEHCNHERRFHINPDAHDTCKTSRCTKLECSCFGFVQEDKNGTAS